MVRFSECILLSHGWLPCSSHVLCESSTSSRAPHVKASKKALGTLCGMSDLLPIGSTARSLPPWGLET